MPLPAEYLRCLFRQKQIISQQAVEKIVYLCFYLHHIEKILNGRIYRFFHREGHIRRLSKYLGTLSEKERDCA